MASSSDFPVSRSPRKELQGPRPPALKVRKDSYKIKKPPVAPPQQPDHEHHHRQQTQPRPPVIIYTVSPKVIHTNPDDFMTLVQRLTGSSSSTSSSTSAVPNSNPWNDDGGAISPAARYAAIERAKSAKEKQQLIRDPYIVEDDIDMMDRVVERQKMVPGILSPGPASLQPIPPNYFSPLSDPTTISFVHDLSPVFHGDRNLIEGAFMPSPSIFVSPRMTSPTTPSIDLFNNFNTSNNLFDL